MKKIVVFLMVIALSSTTMSGCLLGREHRFEYHPANQLNSFWETEDKQVSFMRNANAFGLLKGVVKTNEGDIDIYFSISPQVTDVTLAYPDDVLDGVIEGFASGTDKVISEDEYSITITSADSLFEEGAVLVFHKVDYCP